MPDAPTSGLPEVTVLLPCLDEEESIGSVLAEIHAAYARSGIRYEVLVADNGSTDRSPEIARAAGARVVRVAQRGYGAALLAGIEAASGEYIVMGDADGSYRFGESIPMIAMLRSGADMVIGNRFEGGIAPGAMPWLHRYVGVPVLSFVGRAIFGITVGDFHCGLRALHARRIRELHLNAQGMEFASEMIVVASRAGLRIRQAPATLSPDLRSGPSHLRTWRDGWRHLRYLLTASLPRASSRSRP